MLRKLALLIVGGIALVVFVLLFNALTFESKQVTVSEISPLKIDPDAVMRFSGGITFETISYQDTADFKAAPFTAMHDYLATSFPLTDSLLQKQMFGLSVLYTWEGTDKGLSPVVLMSHLDVVPVDMATIDGWEAAPFSGAVKDDKIYGRGTMDDKISVFAIMEAVETLLTSGFKPKQTIYLAFGHDEEIGGDQGARLIANAMKAMGIKPAFVLDEGGYVADGMVPGIEQPLAMINVAEKGYVSFEMTLTTNGGHSSNPPKDNTIGSLASAIVKLEANQFPTRMIEPLRWQIEHVGPELPFANKLVFANSWLFSHLLLEGLSGRTTTAPTIFHGGVKDNVIPTQAKAVVNFRILQGESVEDVKQHIIEIIDDERISLQPVSNVNEPSLISDINVPQYKTIEKTVKQTIPDVIVSPGLLGAGTDSKHYEGIAENIYRFFPIRINRDNMTGFHGINEHITIDNYHEVIRFYHQLIINLNSPA